MASRTPQAVAEAYFEVRRDKDFGAIRTLLHDDVAFNGPFVSLSNADDVINAITQPAWRTGEDPGEAEGADGWPGRMHHL